MADAIPVETEPRFVEVYDKTTGRKQAVPEHFLTHPVLSANIRKTPLAEKQQREADALLAAANPDETPAAGDKE